MNSVTKKRGLTNRERGLGCVQAAIIAVPTCVCLFWVPLFVVVERMLR